MMSKRFAVLLAAALALAQNVAVRAGDEVSAELTGRGSFLAPVTEEELREHHAEVLREEEEDEYADYDGDEDLAEIEDDEDDEDEDENKDEIEELQRNHASYDEEDEDAEMELAWAKKGGKKKAARRPARRPAAARPMFGSKAKAKSKAVGGGLRGRFGKYNTAGNKAAAGKAFNMATRIPGVGGKLQDAKNLVQEGIKFVKAGIGCFKTCRAMFQKKTTIRACGGTVKDLALSACDAFAAFQKLANPVSGATAQAACGAARTIVDTLTTCFTAVTGGGGLKQCGTMVWDQVQDCVCRVLATKMPPSLRISQAKCEAVKAAVLKIASVAPTVIKTVNKCLRPSQRSAGGCAGAVKEAMEQACAGELQDAEVFLEESRQRMRHTKLDKDSLQFVMKSPDEVADFEAALPPLADYEFLFEGHRNPDPEPFDYEEMSHYFEAAEREIEDEEVDAELAAEDPPTAQDLAACPTGGKFFKEGSWMYCGRRARAGGECMTRDECLGGGLYAGKQHRRQLSAAPPCKLGGRRPYANYLGCDSTCSNGGKYFYGGEFMYCGHRARAGGQCMSRAECNKSGAVASPAKKSSGGKARARGAAALRGACKGLDIVNRGLAACEKVNQFAPEKLKMCGGAAAAEIVKPCRNPANTIAALQQGQTGVTEQVCKTDIIEVATVESSMSVTQAGNICAQNPRSAQCSSATSAAANKACTTYAMDADQGDGREAVKARQACKAAQQLGVAINVDVRVNINTEYHQQQLPRPGYPSQPPAITPADQAVEQAALAACGVWRTEHTQDTRFYKAATHKDISGFKGCAQSPRRDYRAVVNARVACSNIGYDDMGKCIRSVNAATSTICVGVGSSSPRCATAQAAQREVNACGQDQAKDNSGKRCERAAAQAAAAFGPMQTALEKEVAELDAQDAAAVAA